MKLNFAVMLTRRAARAFDSKTYVKCGAVREEVRENYCPRRLRNSLCNVIQSIAHEVD